MLKLIIRSAFLGPLFAELLVALSKVPDLANADLEPETFVTAPFALIIVFIISYALFFFMGMLPAVLGGLVYWAWLRYGTNTNPKWPLRAMSGAIIGILSYLLSYVGLQLVNANYLSLPENRYFPYIFCGSGMMFGISATNAIYARVFQDRYPDSTP